MDEANKPTDSMKTTKTKADDSLSAKDKNCQFLPSRITWGGNLEQAAEFRNKMEGYFAQTSAGYLF
jgi:hypothetical protein